MNLVYIIKSDEAGEPELLVISGPQTGLKKVVDAQKLSEETKENKRESER